MNRFLFTFSLLLLAVSAMAGQHVVTSLPDTILQSEHSADLWDTITFSGNLTSTVNGFVLNGSIDGSPPRRWLIDMGGDTINFGTADGNSLYGIRIIGGAWNKRPRYVTIQNGTIIHKPTNSRSSDTTIVRDNACLNLTVDDIKVINVNMMADGYNGKCIVAGAGYNVEISGGHYKSLVNYFRSRCQVDALIMGLTQTYDAQFASDSGFSYCIKVHGLRMDSIPHMGIRFDGGDYGEYGIVQIYNCTINVDSRNLLYVTGGTCASSANCYGIAIQFPGPGSEIYNNVITSGTNYRGGRGILVEGSAGNADTNVLIHDNYLNVNEGPNAEYPENNVENHALRIRNDGIYQHIYNNTVINTGDNDINTDAYAKAISALRYTFGDLSRETISHNTIENNLFKCTSLTTGVTAYGVCFDAVDVLDTTLIFRYNKIQSTNIIAKFGEINTFAAKGITMIGDTFGFLLATYNPQTLVFGHLSNAWQVNGNNIIDGTFQGGASDTNIIFTSTATISNPRTLTANTNVLVPWGEYYIWNGQSRTGGRDTIASVLDTASYDSTWVLLPEPPHWSYDTTLSHSYNYSGGVYVDTVWMWYSQTNDIATALMITASRLDAEVALKRNIYVYVKGSDNLPVNDANVVMVSNYGDTIVSGNTNANGIISGYIPYWYEHNVEPDSLLYGNYTMIAKKLTDSTSNSFAVTVTSQSADTLILSATGGSTPTLKRKHGLRIKGISL